MQSSMPCGSSTIRPSIVFAEACDTNRRNDSPVPSHVNRRRLQPADAKTSDTACKISAVHCECSRGAGAVGLSAGTSTPTVPVRPRARPMAVELGTNPSSSITARTRSAVSRPTSPLPLSTRDTVVLLTPACLATSAIVIDTAAPHVALE